MEEQLALFHLPEGFVIENVSHEKLGAIKPISLGFDDAGRLWTQTASEYPNDNNPIPQTTTLSHQYQPVGMVRWF